MLFKVLFTVMVVYVMSTPYFYALAFRYGLSVSGKKVENVPVFTLPKSSKTPEMTDAEKRDMQILANLSRYDGTAKGQVKVK